MTRRAILALAPAAFGAPGPPELTGLFGVTTGSFMPHLTDSAAPGKLVMLDLPAILNGELGMTVLDLMTATLPTLASGYCEKLRANAERSRVIITNLKMNQPGLNLASPDAETRRHAIAIYKRTIDKAAILGCRWVRPLPGPARPDLHLLAASCHELMDYASPRGISLLAENYGWMQGDPAALPAVLDAVGRGMACQPDTGNWTDEARYDGLARAFPRAASCDFKAFELGPDGSHARYDLRRCFDVAWKAGFRGPWCFEHFHAELKPLLRGMVQLRDMLRGWTPR